MTFQPPPPPPGGTPPPPPPSGQPGQWGPPPGGGYPQQQRPGGSFDPKTVNPLDWGIVAAGVLAFIFSLFDYYTISVSLGRGFGTSDGSVSAWHGFFGWFAALLALVGAALVAVSLFAPQVNLPVPARLAGLGAFALATLCVIIALFVIPDGGAGDIPGVDTGHGFGYWASLVVVLAGLVLSLMRFQQTGGQLPGGWATRCPTSVTTARRAAWAPARSPARARSRPRRPATARRRSSCTIRSGCRDALARPGIRLLYVRSAAGPG